jgi:ABC-type transport system involved in multi-copper enzyme maturation permease subunit
MLRVLASDWFRAGRYWLTWVLLVGLVALLGLQVNAKLNRLADLEDKPAVGSPTEVAVEQLEVEVLRRDLGYPGFIGAVVRKATELGWFLVVLLAAVLSGEDDTRRTMHCILVKGVGRASYLLGRCLSLWLVTGAGVLAIALLAIIAGPFVHARAIGEPIVLDGLGEVLLVPVRAWIACLPFVAVTLFGATLGRQPGLAVGIGIGTHFIAFGYGFVLPMIAIALAGAPDADVPAFWLVQLRAFAMTLGYCADVLLYWGSPFM